MITLYRKLKLSVPDAVKLSGKVSEFPFTVKGLIDAKAALFEEAASSSAKFGHDNIISVWLEAKDLTGAACIGSWSPM